MGNLIVQGQSSGRVEEPSGGTLEGRCGTQVDKSSSVFSFGSNKRLACKI